jgi:hypothetical protein
VARRARVGGASPHGSAAASVARERANDAFGRCRSKQRMEDRCDQCLCEVPERLGYLSPGGQTLCGPCYYALWGPIARAPGAPSERARPESRRPAKGRPIWIPGPTGELDSEEAVRRIRQRRRKRS